MRKDVLIQKIINKIKGKTYLEIGVETGENIFAIKAWRKIAVDPCFRFKIKTLVKFYVENPTNFFIKHYKMTSDNFFRILKKTIRLVVKIFQ